MVKFSTLLNITANVDTLVFLLYFLYTSHVKRTRPSLSFRKDHVVFVVVVAAADTKYSCPTLGRDIH